MDRAGRVVTATLGDWDITQISGKTAAADLRGCGGADIVIMNTEAETPRPCIVYDVVALRQSGALAMDVTDTGALAITTARSLSGMRPWNTYGGRRDMLQSVTLQKETDRQGGPQRIIQIAQD
jgi:competence protein ComEC